MHYFKQLVTTLSLAITVVQAVTNFGGIAVSNSPSTPSYTCRSQAQWNDIANQARNNGFRSIRIIGFDCEALPRAASAAASAGLTVLAGIWVDGSMAQSAGNIRRDLDTFRAAYNQFGSGRFAGLTIGNEVGDSAVNIINKVNESRNFLRSVGVNTPVSTVHTWVFIRDNRVLCNADFVGANAHAFFDGNFAAEQTGDFVFKTVVPNLKSACPGREIRITESGWPTRGPANGRAVPGLDQARSALLNLNCACRDDRSVTVYAFEADDQIWKPENDWERSFGIFGKFNLNGEVFAPC
ncbi:glycoside hydrolase [Coprinopsis marcescibilis]|uniref:Glycoside hydrolase n=1 Tax=Coprinopsis marcescibilis TaxID=230819 RepID=A0A5C3LBS2_COPMA|nr:glycoside hydrolase [Coprinopsis marcescibilis]